MDKAAGVNPLELAESGALLEIGDATGSGKGLGLEYVAGTLEAGRLDGKQYAVPLLMNTPVLYGLKSDLQAAGLDTENGYGDLKRFLEALAGAQEKTGKQIFENETALDWMEAYCLPETGDGELERLIGGLRESCGSDGGFFGSYEAIHAGKCLLGGCGAEDYRRLAQNLSLFGRDAETVFFNVPSYDGEILTELTCMMGVNKNTECPEDALDVLLTFQKFAYDADGVSPLTRFFDVECKSFDDFQGISAWIGGAYAGTYGEMNEKIGGDKEKEWETCVYDNVTGAACREMKPEGDGTAGTDAPEKETLTVMYRNESYDGEGDFDRWLESAAKSYETESLHVQLVVYREECMFLDAPRMEAAGVAPDVILFSNARLGSSVREGLTCRDVSDYLASQEGRLGFLPGFLRAGVAAGGSAVGLPYAAEEWGVWYDRELAARAGLPEDWSPGTAAGLLDGLGRMREAMGTEEAVCVIGDGLNSLRPLYCFASPEPEKLAFWEDGEWRTDRDAWARTVQGLLEIKESGLVTYGESAMRLAGGVTAMGAAEGLADGTYAAVWAGSGFGAVWNEKEKERLAFAPLSGMVMPDVFCISENCGKPELAEGFWLHALRDGRYETGVAGVGRQPLTQMSENACLIFPPEMIKDHDYDLWADVWQTDKTAEELAERYTLYRLTTDD